MFLSEIWLIQYVRYVKIYTDALGTNQIPLPFTMYYNTADYTTTNQPIICLCLRIEETWRLWQKFLDDFSRFEDWLKTSERTAALPNSSGVLYTVAKEELKKFEVCPFHFYYQSVE